MKKFYILFILLVSISCGGSVSNVTSGDSNLAFSIIEEQNNSNDIVMLASDFSSPSQLLIASEDGTQLVNTGVGLLGSDALVKIFNGEIYILNHGFSRVSSENLQIINPRNGFSTSFQISTGNGTNPQDFIIREVNGKTYAFISLYNPELSNDDFISSNQIDLIVLDLDNNGNRISSLSFQEYLNDDNSKTARAACMIETEDFIYVCIQDLQDGDGQVFFPNASGKIARIHPEDFSVEVFSLQGRNPLDMEYSVESGKLYIAHLAFKQNIETEFGGLEILDEESLADGSFDINEDSIFITDNEFGGYTERLTLSDEELFVVASNLDAQNFQLTSQVFKADLDLLSRDDFEVVIDDGEDIREIKVDRNNHLWIAARQLSASEGEAELPRVYVYDLDQSQNLTSPLVPVVPVVSIAIGDL